MFVSDHRNCSAALPLMGQLLAFLPMKVLSRNMDWKTKVMYDCIDSDFCEY